jgi:molybdopterin-binding protein
LNLQRRIGTRQAVVRIEKRPLFRNTIPGDHGMTIFRRRNFMKLSARNVLPATIKVITPGAVDSEVVVELAPGIEIVSIITKKSAEKLGLKPGAKAYAIVKASNVMIGVD